MACWICDACGNTVIFQNLNCNLCSIGKRPVSHPSGSKRDENSNVSAAEASSAISDEENENSFSKAADASLTSQIDLTIPSSSTYASEETLNMNSEEFDDLPADYVHYSAAFSEESIDNKSKVQVNKVSSVEVKFDEAFLETGLSSELHNESDVINSTQETTQPKLSAKSSASATNLKLSLQNCSENILANSASSNNSPALPTKLISFHSIAPLSIDDSSTIPKSPSSSFHSIAPLPIDGSSSAPKTSSSSSRSIAPLPIDDSSNVLKTSSSSSRSIAPLPIDSSASPKSSVSHSIVPLSASSLQTFVPPAFISSPTEYSSPQDVQLYLAQEEVYSY